MEHNTQPVNQAVKKLSEVAEKLLDLGKNNQLINLKTSGGRAVELVLPEGEAIFKGLMGETSFNLVLPSNVEKDNFAQNDELENAEDIAYELALDEREQATTKPQSKPQEEPKTNIEAAKVAASEAETLEEADSDVEVKIELANEVVANDAIANEVVNQEAQVLKVKDLASLTQTKILDEESLDATNELKASTHDNFAPAMDARLAKRERKAQALGIGLDRADFIQKFEKYVKRGQVLPYSANSKKGVAEILEQIAKAGKTSLEENGVNVLFATLGIISWQETEDDDKVYKAPLLLLPILLEKTGGILSSFKLKGLDDDVIVNPTFVLKMHREFKLDLPEFGKEENLLSYLEKARVILEKAKFTLSNECALGVFSFVKISMYHDLMDHGSEILKSQDVCSILGEAQEDDNAPLDTASLEETLAEAEDNPLISLHNVVDADATQLAAIKMAASGKSFVLQGPPGTGKSQTITNIIAEILAQGRRVLFVSEKQAALKVVYNKMRKAGLEDFCLEIHSSKVSKKDVIGEVCRTLNLNRIHTTDKALRDSSRRKDLIGELEGYEHELHAELPDLHCSLYKLYEDYWALTEKTKAVSSDAFFEIPNIAAKNLDYCDRICAELQKFGSYAESLGDGADVRKNPWYGLSFAGQTEAKRREFFTSLNLLAEHMPNLADLARSWAKGGFNAELSLKDLQILVKTYDLLERASYVEVADLFTNGSKLEQVLGDLGDQGRELATLYNKFAQECDGDFMSFAAASSEALLKNNYHGGVTRFFSALFGGEYKKLLASIAGLRRDRLAPKYEEALSFCHSLSNLQTQAREFTQKLASYELATLTKQGILVDWNALEAEVLVVKEFGALNFLVSDSSLPSASEELLRVLKQAHDVWATEQDYWTGADFAQMVAAFNNDGMDLATMPLQALEHKVSSALKRSNQFDTWREFRAVLNTLATEDLLQFVFKYGETQADPKLLADYYRFSWTRGRIEAVLLENPVLGSFSAVEHGRAINEFKKLDQNIFAINCVYIKSLLSAKRPDLDALVPSSPVFQILREGQKKSRLMGVREFMNKFGDVVMDVKPCFLMSPLSVSTYLKPENGLFDAVIFDEASQIFAQDALGAIYRGKQVIVVGDSRQMPPSNFFGSNLDGEALDDDASDIANFESILDLCAGSFKNLQLNWHYRSRFEELIAFSNNFIYEGRLVSFPAAQAETAWNGVSYRYVLDAVYASNINIKEAQAVVETVFLNLQKFPQRSLGVVTFSIKQQALIERLLEQERLRRPEFEEYFSSSREDPFFVKNLETVQGDERDTIIFSITFGRDAQGRFSRNFGPLSREGGERRLNVAVTRAKISVQVVASIHAHDIDVKGLTFRGPALLHHYLDFAERGAVALESHLNVEASDWFDSPFEEEVATFLRTNGYIVDTQVGCSTYRIDLGLRKPESSDYLLAIECDGRTYHSSKNARDRDRLRQSILEGMGWEFYRIWSTDWFRNNTQAKKNLLLAVKQAIAKRAQEDSASTAPNEACANASYDEEGTSTLNLNETTSGQEKTLEANSVDLELLANQATKYAPEVVNSQIEDKVAQLGSVVLAKSKDGVNKDLALGYGAEEEPDDRTFALFTPFDIPCMVDENRTSLVKMMVQVVKCEGEVAEELLLKRLFVACGHSTRLSEDFRNKFVMAYETYAKALGLRRTAYQDVASSGSGVVYFWRLDGVKPTFKVPSDDSSRRDLYAISPAELASGMHHIIAINRSCGRLELYRKLNSALLFKKLTSKALKYYDLAFQELSVADKARVDLDN